MTVSFVLNNKQGEVSEETRERVLKAIRDLDYRPRAADHPSKQREILTLGLVAGVGGHSLLQPGYYSSIVNGILTASDRLSHNITLFTNSILHAAPHQSLRIYCDGRCDGLMVLAPHRDSPLVAALIERGVPVVLIGDTGDVDTVSYVDINNVANGRQLTEYLIGLGHQRIAFIGGPEFVRSSNQRYAGYCEALNGHGLVVDPELTAVSNLYPTDVDSALERMLRLPHGRRPTAIFGWNDGVASRGIDIAKSLSLRIPLDVSVVGIDDDPNVSMYVPRLTTIRQPYEEIGLAVVRTLIELVRGTASGPTHLLLPTERVEGESIAPPPGDPL